MTGYAYATPPLPPLPICLYRSSDSAGVTSSTALVNDDTLVVAIPANASMFIDYHLRITTAAAGGIKLAVTAPSGATTVLFFGSYITTATTYGFANASGSAFSLTTAAANGQLIARAIVVNGATAGNITLQYAQSVSSGTTTILQTGSSLVATYK